MKQAGNKAGADSLDGIVAGLTMQPSLRARRTHVFLHQPEGLEVIANVSRTLHDATISIAFKLGWKRQ